jgi:aminocarboxymuconate-semialdehyde decarboxylase
MRPSSLIIDLHAHFYPKRFLEQFETLGKYGFEVKKDAFANRVLYQHGKLVATYTDSFCRIDYRLEEMTRGRVDLQALSVVQPGIFWAEPELGLALCKIINDEIYEVIKKYPDHFIGIASVPLQDVGLAIQELERSVHHLGFRGVVIGTNINGIDLDADELFPFYQKVEDLGIPIFVHPFSPKQGKERFFQYHLEPILGFMFENSVAISKVILGGVMERYPKLKLCFAHLGGGMPYLIGRVDKGATVYPETNLKISRPPSFYLRKVYLDTAYFYGPALHCALSTMPEEHFVFGTDFPFLIGDSPEKAVLHIQQDPLIADAFKHRLFSENPAKLLEVT